MRNLLAGFCPKSYIVVTAAGSVSFSPDQLGPDRTHQFLPRNPFPPQLDRLWRDCQLNGATRRLVKLVREVQPSVIVGVYPDFHFLSMARHAARETRTPWIAYFHDTLLEGLAGSRLRRRAAELQGQVFREASRCLVMSQGMADLFTRKYDLSCLPVPHAYPEPIPAELPLEAPLRSSFWGGAVYSINTHAVGRVSKAMARIQCPFVLTSNSTLPALRRLGIEGDLLQLVFYADRSEYLNCLQKHAILVLALDWPDESAMHEDELSTIFPTKTPEYLAAGRPILVHCPEHYFLARFFRENHCGLVVSDRSVEALADASSRLLANGPEIREMRQSALSAARRFAAGHVASSFQQEVQKAANAQWGQAVT